LALDARSRKMIDQAINTAILQLPYIVKIFFNPSNRAILKIEKESDFALGIALAHIQAEIFIKFKNLHDGRVPTNDEIKEIAIIIFERLPHIHEAIFRAG
jgi:hypothetical protein